MRPRQVWPGILVPALMITAVALHAHSTVAAGPQIGETFRDCANCPEMIVLPPGEFLMGSPETGHDRWKTVTPQHLVRIGYAYAVGKDEVTFEQWDACVDASGCSHRPKDYGWGRGPRPVIDVSWEDAQSYIRWLSRSTGRQYRLLSEAEWEYAARAGTATIFPAESQTSADKAKSDGAYTCENARKNSYDSETTPVGSTCPNGFGLHDMHGNVWEWVEDCWNDRYIGAPADGEAWRSGDCGLRVKRGGTWFGLPWRVYSWNRIRVEDNYRSGNSGFRVATAATRMPGAGRQRGVECVNRLDCAEGQARTEPLEQRAVDRRMSSP